MNATQVASGPGPQQTLPEMVTAADTISRAFDASPDTVATTEFSEVVSAAACSVAAFTAAAISAAVGATVPDRAAASFDTAATADRSAAIWARRDAAAAGTLAPAAAALADPARVAATPEATREQLLVAMGYAAARTALSPLRASAVPVADDDLSASSVALDLSTRERAASVFNAAARAGSAVAAPDPVVEDVAVGAGAVVEVVVDVDDVVVDVVLVDGVASVVLHPPRRQTATAAVTSVLRCMARTPHHIVVRTPAPSSHPVGPVCVESCDTTGLSPSTRTCSSEWPETVLQSGDSARHRAGCDYRSRRGWTGRRLAVHASRGKKTDELT